MRTLLVLAAILPSAFSLSAEDAPVRQWRHDRLDGAVFYEVFVRSFRDSDGDGIGDLRGLIEKLDYLNDGDPATTDDLGVRGLWLMPVFPSPSYHGYDVSDYRAIEPDYGDVADFGELVDEAARRGMEIVLDLVINHTSAEHPWFVDAVASGSKRPWYVWSETNPGWTQPWGNGTVWHPSPVPGSYYYGLFWQGMPDLDLAHAKTRREIDRIARWWLKRGASGFRLDAARYLIETGGGAGQQDTAATHAFWRRFAKRIRKRFPRAVLVGENWAGTPTIATYFGSTDTVAAGDELPLNFNFPLSDAILRAVRRADRNAIAGVLSEMSEVYPKGVRDAPFLTNHDQRRLASQLGDQPARLRLAASVLLTLPGLPFLYYGEEVGLRNGPGSADEAKRTPMPWDDGPTAGFTEGTPWYPLAPGHTRTNVAVQSGEPGSLLSHYRDLIRLRAESPAIAAGELDLLDLGNRRVLSYVRSSAGDRVVVAINLGSGLETVSSIDLDARPGDLLFGDGNGARLSGSPGNLTLFLPPWATAVWDLEDR